MPVAEPDTSRRLVGTTRLDNPVVVSHADSAVEWDAYVSAHPDGTADHLWGWRRVFESALGHRTAYLVARRGGIVSGVLPLVLFKSQLFGRCVISLPFLNYGGLLVDDEASGSALVNTAISEAKTFKASHVELRHVNRQCVTLPFRQHKLRMALSLPDSPEALWTGLDRKIRNQVRKAQKESLTPVTGGRELVDDFYAVFATNMRDLGTPVYPKGLFLETMDAFGERARVFVIRRGATAVAGGLTMRLGHTVLNPWASSLREFRSLSPNTLLYWQMVERAVIDGATVFDFGRSSPGGGTHQFKEQWGAQPAPLHWEYVLLTRAEPPNQGPTNATFDRLIALWKKLPLPVANTVGPIVARHLP